MIDRNHPAVEAAARTALAGGWTCDTHEPEPWGECRDCTDSHLRSAPRALNTALEHLTADDLPTRLIRDIQGRTIRAAARAATYEGDCIPWDNDWDRATVAGWLEELADNIEREADA